MKDDDKHIEKILLNNDSYEKLLKSRQEAEFVKIIENKDKKSEIITDFKKVSPKELFTKNTLYLVINKQSKTQSYINGIQADGYLGAQNNIRNEFMSGKTDSFVSGDNYIKFYKYKS